MNNTPIFIPIGKYCESRFNMKKCKALKGHTCTYLNKELKVTFDSDTAIKDELCPRYNEFNKREKR